GWRRPPPPSSWATPCGRWATPTAPWRRSNGDCASTATTTASGDRSSPPPTTWATKPSPPGPAAPMPRCSSTSASARLHLHVGRDELGRARLYQHRVGHARRWRPLRRRHHLKLDGEGRALDEDRLVVLSDHREVGRRQHDR